MCVCTCTHMHACTHVRISQCTSGGQSREICSVFPQCGSWDWTQAIMLSSRCLYPLGKTIDWKDSFLCFWKAHFCCWCYVTRLQCFNNTVTLGWDPYNCTVCACVSSGAWIFVHMNSHVHAETRAQDLLLFLRCYPLWLLTQGLSLVWKSPSKLG